jgi:hypothetical protein
MDILRVFALKILNFKSARLLLLTLFVHADWALLCFSSLNFEGVGTYDSEERQIFSDLSQISITLEHGFYVRAS